MALLDKKTVTISRLIVKMILKRYSWLILLILIMDSIALSNLFSLKYSIIIFFLSSISIVFIFWADKRKQDQFFYKVMGIDRITTQGIKIIFIFSLMVVQFFFLSFWLFNTHGDI
jgi:hypothetical protein